MIMEVEKSQGLHCEGLRAKRADGENACLGLKAEVDQCPGWRSLSGDSTFTFFLAQALNWLDAAHPHWGGQSALLSQSIHMLISCRNTLKDTIRIMFNQGSGYPYPSQVDT